MAETSSKLEPIRPMGVLGNGEKQQALAWFKAKEGDVDDTEEQMKLRKMIERKQRWRS